MSGDNPKPKRRPKWIVPPIDIMEVARTNYLQAVDLRQKKQKDCRIHSEMMRKRLSEAETVEYLAEMDLRAVQNVFVVAMPDLSS